MRPLTYNSYLPSIFGTNALIWGYFPNYLQHCFWGHWGQRMIEVEFWACDMKFCNHFESLANKFIVSWICTIQYEVIKWITNQLLYMHKIFQMNFCHMYVQWYPGYDSYRGLPYFFEVGSQTFKNDCKILRSQHQNSTSIVLSPQWPQKQHAQVFWK